MFRLEALSLSFAENGGAPLEAVQPRSLRRDKQVQRILEAAKACFVRAGFQGASMQQICAEAGMSPGALYRYFPSKEAIVEAIAVADRSKDAEFLSLIEDGATVLDGMVAASIAFLRSMYESGDVPMFLEIRAEAMRNPSVRDSIMDCACAVEDKFRDHLAKAIERNEIRPVVPLDALCSILMSIGDGMAMSSLPDRGVSFPDAETALRAMLEALLRPQGDPASSKP